MTQQQERAGTLRIFASYSSEDRWFADLLLGRLANHPDVSVFATQNLSAAGDYRLSIKQELQAAGAFLVLLSPRSVRSNWVLYEFGAAWALGKPIVAVLTDPAVPNLANNRATPVRSGRWQKAPLVIRSVRPGICVWRCGSGNVMLWMVTSRA